MSIPSRVLGALALAMVAFIPASGKGISSKLTPAKTESANVDSLTHSLAKRAVCTLLLNSELQNAHYEQEATAADADKGTLLTLTSAIAKGGATSSTDALFAMPAALFPTLVLPAERFVGLKLDDYIICYDSIRPGVTAEEAALYNPKSTGQVIGEVAKSTAVTAARGLSSATKSLKKGMKKAAGAAFEAATDAIGITDEVKAVSETATSVVSTTKSTVNALTGKKEEQKADVAETVASSTLLYEDEVDEYANAVIHNYLTNRHVAARLVAQWYDYAPDSLTRWSLAPALIDREDSAIVVADSSLMEDTYVVVTNLRLRSLQAIRKEVATVAKSAGSTFGAVGKLAVGAASTASAAVIGDGYAVQAVSYLYKLRWDGELDTQFRSAIVGTNATLDDLMGSGLCSLDYVGREKATVNILQSVVSSQTADRAIKDAIERAVDESVAKLF